MFGIGEKSMIMRVRYLWLCAVALGCQPNSKQNPTVVSAPAPGVGDQDPDGPKPLETPTPGATGSVPVIKCPPSWTVVPGDKDFQTTDFCAMTYEARVVANQAVSQAGGAPRVSGSSQDARVSCGSLGEGYGLMNNSEWMTAASNIASNPANWYGNRGNGFGFGTAGAAINPAEVLNYHLTMIRGHVDNNPPSLCDGAQELVDGDCQNSGKEDDPTQRRTFKLTNNAVLWDLAGNAWEWVDYFNTDAKPYAAADGGPVAAFREYPTIDGGFEKMSRAQLIPHKKSFWVNTWSTEQGIGGYFGAPNQTGGALMRGGFYMDDKNAGVFFADLARPPASVDSYISFRCVKRK